MPLLVKSSCILKHLSECRDLMNDVHETLRITHGAGTTIPESTVQTWDLAKRGLDRLYKQWEHGMKGKNILNDVSSAECKNTIKDLEQILVNAKFQHAKTADTEANLVLSEADRWFRFREWKETEGLSWLYAFDVMAYRTIYALHRLTLKKGWASHSDFTPVLSEDELRTRERTFYHYMRQEEGVSKGILHAYTKSLQPYEAYF